MLVALALAVGVLLGAALASVGRAMLRAPAPPSSRRPTSILVERVEAPGSRPFPTCARCGETIVKRREGQEMITRIEGRILVRLHDSCADEDGEPLPPGW